MTKLKVAFSRPAGGEWYIGMEGKGIRLATSEDIEKYIVKGMELWQMYDDGEKTVTISRQRVLIKTGGFSPFYAVLTVRVEDGTIASARLASDAVQLQITEPLDVFTFEAFIDE